MVGPGPWAKFQNDFDGLTDAEIEALCHEASDRVAEDEEWLEAVAAWKQAGQPRSGETVSPPPSPPPPQTGVTA